MRLITHWLPLLLWSALILCASNDNFSDEQSQSWIDQLLGREVHRAVNVGIRKSAHVAVYAVLAALAWRALSLHIARPLLGTPAIALGIALYDEFHQALTMARSGSLFDVCLDGVGVVLGMVLMRRRGRE